LSRGRVAGNPAGERGRHQEAEAKGPKNLSDTAWLFVAFAAVWVGIGGYLLILGVRQRRLERRLDHLDAEARH
jgi:CcmD family protein